MEISKIEEAGKIIVSVEGWLDVETTVQMDEYLNELDASKELVIDFDKLEYISSSGIRAIVATYRRHKDAGSTISVINVNSDVFDVFSMTGIDKKISIIAK